MPKRSQDKSRSSVRPLEFGRRPLLTTTLIAGIIPAVVVTSPAYAEPVDAGDWIPTWGRQPAAGVGARLFRAVGISRSLRNQTVREIARVSLGGNRVRVMFSNEYGSEPLVIGPAHVALGGNGAGITPGSGSRSPSPATPQSPSRPARRSSAIRWTFRAHISPMSVRRPTGLHLDLWKAYLHVSVHGAWQSNGQLPSVAVRPGSSMAYTLNLAHVGGRTSAR